MKGPFSYTLTQINTHPDICTEICVPQSLLTQTFGGAKCNKKVKTNYRVTKAQVRHICLWFT